MNSPLEEFRILFSPLLKPSPEAEELFASLIDLGAKSRGDCEFVVESSIEEFISIFWARLKKVKKIRFAVLRVNLCRVAIRPSRLQLMLEHTSTVDEQVEKIRECLLRGQ